MIVASVAFIFSAMYKNFAALGELSTSWAVFGWLVAASVGCALANLLLTAAWGVLLRPFIGAAATPMRIVVVYGRSQIAKYLPGNVLHYVGRQMLGQRYGWSQAGMAAASFGETLVISLTAVVVVVLAGGAEAKRLWGLVPDGAGALAAGALVIIGAALVVAARTDRGRGWIGDIAAGLGRTPAAIGLSALLYAAFFLIVGSLLGGVLGAIADAESALAWAIFAFSAAWLVGYVVPGAPGGLGVRDAALVLLLAEAYSEPAALLAALVMRCATTFGDCIHFFVVSSLARRTN